MATYKSKPTAVGRPAEAIFERFSDMTRLQEIMDRLPEEQRAMIGDVVFTQDSMKIRTPQIGEIAFGIKERVAPERIVFATESSPVPLEMAVLITPDGDEQSIVQTVIDVEIPAMLRPLIGPKLQEAADKFGSLIAGLS